AAGLPVVVAAGPALAVVDSAVSVAPGVPVLVAADLTAVAVAAPSAAAVVDSALSGSPVGRALAAGSAAGAAVAASALAAVAGSAFADAVVRAWNVVPACPAFQASFVSRPADPVVRRPEHRLQELKTRGPL